MTATTKFLWIVLLLALAVAGVTLSMWGIPAPSAEIHKKIPIETSTYRSS
tara:strand:+ start:1099 stop:1248 length:150 start_codon:yes stop_codon:yes gene_type:complete